MSLLSTPDSQPSIKAILLLKVSLNSSLFSIPIVISLVLTSSSRPLKNTCNYHTFLVLLDTSFQIPHCHPSCLSEHYSIISSSYILASDQEHKTLTSWMPTLLNTVLDISHIFVIPCKGCNDSDKKIILCCRSGKRGSERLNSFLTQLSQSSISKTGYSYYKALFL